MKILKSIIVLVAAIFSIFGFVAFLRGERDEYRIKKAVNDATEARRGVENMREMLMLPRMATPQEIGIVK